MADIHHLPPEQQTILEFLVARRASIMATIAEYQTEVDQIGAAIKELTPEIGEYRAGGLTVRRQINRTFDRAKAMEWVRTYAPDALAGVATPEWVIDRNKFAKVYPEAAAQCWRVGEAKLVIV